MTPERAIETLMEDRLGRPCLFAPSGRLAVYVALRAWLGPGDRLLMSPVTDDVIFFTALAAGLRPVMAPISPDDGNIDPAAVPEDVWATLGGVLTTNLYGLPDRVHDLRARCDRLRIPLIEDAAHAMETEVAGRRIGTFGDAAAFSLSKHVGAHGGGVIAFGDEALRPALEALRDAAVPDGGGRDRWTGAGSHVVESLVVALHLVWPVRRLRRLLGATERTGDRMPLRPGDLRRALAAAPELGAFHPWVRVDRHDYRVRQPRFLLEQALRRLRALERDRERRLEGVERLRELPGVAPAACEGDPQPLFRVPILVGDRGDAIGRLERRVHGLGYVYDPPLDDYAGPEFADPSPLPGPARRWAASVLPVDPLEADAVRAALG
jgi:dTDP-4-amino-4,6-dideoxygalactose transaminase